MIRKIQLVVATLLLVACTNAHDTLSPIPDSEQTKDIQKIINKPNFAAKGSLIICFNDNAIATIEQSTAAVRSERTVVTRSGITSLDDILSIIEVKYLERVFPYNSRTEERSRMTGLHKWYVVYFDSEVDISVAAQKFATVSEVQYIQFNTCMERVSDFKIVPFSQSTKFNTKSSGSAPFNDPMLPRQWHYINDGNKEIAPTCRAGADVNAGEAWKITTGDPKIIVAIVDEGVKYTHPDLKANMWANQAELNGIPGVDDDGNGYIDDIYGYNFATNGAISWTFSRGEGKGDVGHGTHVAGTVAAVNNNGIGVSGVAGGSNNKDGIRMMSCQIMSGELGALSPTSVSVSRAFKYAADMGASIIQCSFGATAGLIASDDDYKKGNAMEYAALNYFISTSNCDAIDGGLAIFSAGNDRTRMSSYPGAYRKCISVTAIGPDYLPAYYTNYGPGVNIAAPGGDVGISVGTQTTVLSTIPSEIYKGDDYGYMQGTSMASPHVSGVAALGLSYALAKGKRFTNSEFKTMILTSVNDLDSYMFGIKESRFTMNLSDYHLKMGSGAIDAYQLLMQIEGTPCLKAKVGDSHQFPLTKYFGGGASSLTYVDVLVSNADIDKLGITEKPSILDGKLIFKCTKPGIARINITAIAGGNSVGTGASMGGMSITKEVSIIAREVQSGNGGWL